MGEQLKFHELGADLMAGPSAVLHAAGAPHSNRVGDSGLEQLDIEFDPAWLMDNYFPPRLHHVQCWIGGAVGHAAGELVRSWRDGRSSEAELLRTTKCFLRLAFASEQPRQPGWMNRVVQAVQIDDCMTTTELAKQIGLCPAWLTQAYRAAAGEGLHETIRRRRVERAAKLLGNPSWSHAEIAAAAGFCDQSHMIRSFRRLLGRTPSQVLAEKWGVDT